MRSRTAKAVNRRICRPNTSRSFQLVPLQLAQKHADLFMLSLLSPQGRYCRRFHQPVQANLKLMHGGVYVDKRNKTSFQTTKETDHADLLVGEFLIHTDYGHC